MKKGQKIYNTTGVKYMTATKQELGSYIKIYNNMQKNQIVLNIFEKC